jgi:transposase-like protein
MMITYTLERTSITCPSCRAERVFFLVDPRYVGPFDWFRCGGCGQVFATSLRHPNPRWLAQQLVYPLTRAVPNRPIAAISAITDTPATARSS